MQTSRSTTETLRRHPELVHLKQHHPEAVFLHHASDYLLDQADALFDRIRQSGDEPIAAEFIHAAFKEGPLAWTTDKLLDTGASGLSARFSELAEEVLRDKATAINGTLAQQHELGMLARSVARWCKERVWAIEAAADTEAAPAPPAEPITLDDTRLCYEGSTRTITVDQAVLMRALIEARGRFISMADLKEPPHNLGRPDRIKNNLPDEIKAIIESQTGRGSRLTCWD